MRLGLVRSKKLFSETIKDIIFETSSIFYGKRTTGNVQFLFSGIIFQYLQSFHFRRSFKS